MFFCFSWKQKTMLLCINVYWDKEIFIPTYTHKIHLVAINKQMRMFERKNDKKNIINIYEAIVLGNLRF